MLSQYVSSCSSVDPSQIDPAPVLVVSETVLASRANARVRNVGLGNGEGRGAGDAGFVGEASELEECYRKVSGN